MTDSYWYSDSQTLNGLEAVGNLSDFRPHPEWTLVARHHRHPHILRMTSPDFHGLPVGLSCSRSALWRLFSPGIRILCCPFYILLGRKSADGPF